MGEQKKESKLYNYFIGLAAIVTFCAGIPPIIDLPLYLLQILFIVLIVIWTYCNFSTILKKIKEILKGKIPVIIVFILTVLIVIGFYLYGLPWISCKFLSPITDLTVNIKKTFSPAVNLPWSNYGTDFGKVEAWSDSGVSNIKSKLSTKFENLKTSGIHSVVWHLFADGRAAPEFDSKGDPKDLDSDFWSDYDDAVKLAETNSLGIFWVLLDYKWFNPPEINNNATIGGHADVITDPEKRKKFFNKILIPLIKRHHQNPHINGWILINEPENAIREGYVQAETLKEFFTEASAIIKKKTCNQHVAIGSRDIPSYIYYWSDLEIDAIIFHHYESYLPPSVHWLYANYPKLKGKNIFNGEFFISQSEKELSRYLYWMRALGFAGAWPWSVNAEYKDAFQVMVDKYTNFVNEVRKKAKINSSFLLQSIQYNESDKEQIEMLTWWKDHLHEMEVTIDRELANYESDRRAQNEAIPINQRWLEDIEQHLTREHQNLEKSENELITVTQSVEENRNWLSRTEKKLQELNTQLENYNRELETIQQRKVEFNEQMNSSCPQGEEIHSRLNSLQGDLSGITTIDEKKQFIINYIEDIVNSYQLSNQCLTILTKYKEHLIWESETPSYLTEVNQNILIETENKNNANNALKNSLSWCEDIKQSIREFQQKIESLETEKTRAQFSINRCKALVEWDSFHIDFGSKVKNDFIPKQLVKLDSINK